MLLNPQKNFQWSLEIDGIAVGGGFNDLAQDITLPKAEFGVTVHGAAGNSPDIETPNKVSFSDMVINKIVKSDNPDNFAWLKIASALTGQPAAYLFNGFLNELENGVTKRRYVIQNAWVKALAPSPKVAKGEDADNSMEEVTISVQAFYPDPIQAFKTAFGG